MCSGISISALYLICLIAFSPLGEDFREKVINVSIVATIVSHGEARGRGKTSEIVFVMFKHSRRRAEREKVSVERKSSILPLSCLTQISSCITRCHFQSEAAPAKLADLQSAAPLMRIFLGGVIDVTLPQDWDHFSVSSLFSRCHFRKTPSELWQSLLLSFPLSKQKRALFMLIAAPAREETPSCHGT